MIKKDFSVSQTEKPANEKDAQYFVYGKNRIKISEHFALEGSLSDLLVNLIQHTASKALYS